MACGPKGHAISIHALLAESDGGSGVGNWPRGIFLSTLSLRRATRSKTHDRHKTAISIHALLAESDAGKHAQPPTQQDFYPRSPCGERLREPTALRTPHQNFYPRSPCGERRIDPDQVPGYTISIHALLAESDRRGAVPVILII